MKGTLLSCYIEGIKTRKDNTVAVTLGTQELSPAAAGSIFSLQNKLACVYISEKVIDQNEINQVDQLDPDLPGKTQSQRLRGVLFKLFDRNNEGYKDFDSYYRHHTEIIIEHLKKKLD